MTLRVGLVTRVSTPGQHEDGISEEMQTWQGDQWAAQNGGVIVNRYRRVGSGGAAKLKRNDFQGVLRDAHLLDVVVYVTVDRVGRDIVAANWFLAELDERNVGLVVIQLDDDEAPVIDCRTESGLEAFQRELDDAARERKKARRRSRTTHSYRKSLGLSPGGPVAVWVPSHQGCEEERAAFRG